MCLLQNRKPLTVEEMYEDMSQVKNVIFHIMFPVDMCLNIIYHTGSPTSHKGPAYARSCEDTCQEINV